MEETALNQLLKWILKYEEANVTPTLREIKAQIEMFKEVEKQQIIDCSIQTTQDCWTSIMEYLGESITFTDEDLQSQKDEAEQYYNENFKI